MWRELLASLLELLTMAGAALLMRWLLMLSTPEHDWELAKQTVSDIYDRLRIPGLDDWFNMARLTRLREHPDVAIVVEGSVVPSEPDSPAT